MPVSLRFPLEAKVIDSSWYISDPLINGNMVRAGNDIFSINGITVDEIKDEIYMHIASQAKNQSFKRILFNGFFTAYVPYALGFPESYEIVMKGKNEPISLQQLSEYEYKPRIDPKADCRNNLCSRFQQDDDVAIMTIRSLPTMALESLKFTKRSSITALRKST